MKPHPKEDSGRFTAMSVRSFFSIPAATSLLVAELFLLRSLSASKKVSAGADKGKQTDTERTKHSTSLIAVVMGTKGRHLKVERKIEG